MTLLVPKYLANDRLEHRKRLEERFMGLLEEKIKENEHRKDPYWIVYKLKCQKEKHRRPFDEFCFVSEILPPKQNASVCYEVDNSKGTKVLRWVVEA